jgi:hypothetical protein
MPGTKPAMHGRPLRRLWLAFSLAALVLAPACADNESEDARFTDPFAYCAEIQDIDAPDERYVGEAVPDPVVEGIRNATGASADAPTEFFRTGTYWRCMGGEVYACTVGANLPCEAKADTSEAPSSEMAEFCEANSDAEAIPATVTGRETVFAWTCDGDEAVVERQVFHVDGRGFIAEIWYQLESPES